MRILYLGNYQHPHCTEVHLARELEALGHRVYRLQEPNLHRHHRQTLETIRTVALREGSGPMDLFMWTRTWGLPQSATALWRELEAGGVKTASYHLDLYRGLQRSGRVAADPFWTTGYVFTPDGNIDADAWFRRQGINHYVLPPAVVSDECYLAEPDPDRFPHDVVFVGSGMLNYHHEWPWRGRLIEALRRRYRDRLGHYGLGGVMSVRNADLNTLYATAKVVVGDSLALHSLEAECYTSDRFFETLGRGGVLVYPKFKAIDNLGFLPWLHYAPLERLHTTNLCEVVDRLLEDDALRGYLRSNGRSFVKRDHTYQHRLQYALDVIGGTE